MFRLHVGGYILWIGPFLNIFIVLGSCASECSDITHINEKEINYFTEGMSLIIRSSFRALKMFLYVKGI